MNFQKCFMRTYILIKYDFKGLYEKGSKLDV